MRLPTRQDGVENRDKVYIWRTLYPTLPSLSFRKHREKSLRFTDSLVRLMQVSLNIDIVGNYFPLL